MQTPRILWSLAILACTIPPLSAAQAHYRTDLTVSRDGVVIGEPSFGLVPGRQADITSLDRNDPEHGFRILITARDAAAANASAMAISVRLDMLFLERNDGEWVLAGEPSLEIEPGKNAAVSFSTSPGRRAAHRYEIGVSIERTTERPQPTLHSPSGRRRSMLVAVTEALAVKPIHEEIARR